jgi:mono/diheme cytochrome c family protein
MVHVRWRGFIGRLMAMLAVSLPASGAGASDVASGRLLAASHCAVCHAIAPGQRNEVADAPPFEAIGRRHGFNAGALVHVILGPHPKMNFMPQRADAEDIAAYIATLMR